MSAGRPSLATYGKRHPPWELTDWLEGSSNGRGGGPIVLAGRITQPVRPHLEDRLRGEKGGTSSHLKGSLMSANESVLLKEWVGEER